MPQKNKLTLPAVHGSSLLFICALMPALLFKGSNIEFFCITQIVLLVWLGWVALQAYDAGARLPVTPVAVCLTLFAGWMAVSLTWSLGSHISVINFWWVGSLVFVFWLYTLTPDRDTLWSHAAAIVLVIGVVLALMGIYQVWVLEQQAQSVFETRNTHAALLNLIVLPLSAYLLLLMDDKAVSRRVLTLLSFCAYLLLLSMFLTASRGGSLSLLVSLGVLIVLCRRIVSSRALALLLGLVVLAYLTTLITIDDGGLTQRLPYLIQDSQRLMIWESSWLLLKIVPWYGIGLGLFYLAYPPFRNPSDQSGGFFAHNDYLQVWIEIGLPGLLLLLAILVACLWFFARAWRGSDARTRVEMTGLFGGLLAVASHSFVDFNLYILSIMMVSGLVLGRFHDQAAKAIKTRSLTLSPARIVGYKAYPVIVVLLCLFPIAYFISLGMANSYFDRSLMLAREGKIEQADEGLAIAQRLSPTSDRILIANADLYRHAITLLPAEDQQGKKSLFDEAVRFLDQAQAANTLRGLTGIVRGRLYKENPALVGDDAHDRTKDIFRRALALNPLMFQGRVEYAGLLLQRGEREEALGILEEGAKYHYYQRPELIPFYALTARLLREAGKIKSAVEIEKRIKELEHIEKSRYSPRGI